jgi:uncharacterized RDD family membrane protein YckC
MAFLNQSVNVTPSPGAGGPVVSAAPTPVPGAAVSVNHQDALVSFSFPQFHFDAAPTWLVAILFLLASAVLVGTLVLLEEIIESKDSGSQLKLAGLGILYLILIGILFWQVNL